MKIKINESGLISNLGAVFSQSSKVIGELMQNGRRAGATFIEISTAAQQGSIDVTISDDGCGVEDFQKLFTVAESGWDSKVKASDNPYGMGAMAMLFAAEKLTVRSNGKSVVVDTQRALQGGDIDEPAQCDEAPASGTSITLHSVNEEESTVKRWVEFATMAYSIPVSLNGQDVPRPLSLESMKHKHPNAKIYETHLGKLFVPAFSNNITVVLQDALIFSDNEFKRPGSARGVVFYATHELQARMPDRDALLNKDEIEKQLRECLIEIQSERLLKARAAMSDDKVFVKALFKPVMKFMPKLLNDIAYLPAEAFNTIPTPSRTSAWIGTEKPDSYLLITPDSEELLVTDNLEDQDTPMAAWYFAYQAEALTLSFDCTETTTTNGLDKAHWVFDLITDISEHQYEITGETDKSFKLALPNNDSLYNAPTLIGTFELVNVSLNRAVPIDSGLCAVQDDFIEHDNVELIDGAYAYIDMRAARNAIGMCFTNFLKQGMDYEEDERQSELDADHTALTNQVQLAIDDDIAQFVQRLLEKNMSHEARTRLANEAVHVSLENNLVVVNKAA